MAQPEHLRVRGHGCHAAPTRTPSRSAGSAVAVYCFRHAVGSCSLAVGIDATTGLADHNEIPIWPMLAGVGPGFAPI
eukprot:1778526-Rhodomonas_salina.1